MSCWGWPRSQQKLKIKKYKTAVIQEFRLLALLPHIKNSRFETWVGPFGVECAVENHTRLRLPLSAQDIPGKHIFNLKSFLVNKSI